MAAYPGGRRSPGWTRQSSVAGPRQCRDSTIVAIRFTCGRLTTRPTSTCVLSWKWQGSSQTVQLSFVTMSSARANLSSGGGVRTPRHGQQNANSVLSRGDGYVGADPAGAVEAELRAVRTPCAGLVAA